MSIIIAVIIIVIYLASPIIGKAVLLLINTVIQDPIPLVDEIIMWIGLLQHVDRSLRIKEYITLHKHTIVKTITFVGVGIFLLIYFIFLAVQTA